MLSPAIMIILPKCEGKYLVLRYLQKVDSMRPQNFAHCGLLKKNSSLFTVDKNIIYCAILQMIPSLLYSALERTSGVTGSMDKATSNHLCAPKFESNLF